MQKKKYVVKIAVNMKKYIDKTNLNEYNDRIRKFKRKNNSNKIYQ